jgi:hypothetical protein
VHEARTTRACQTLDALICHRVTLGYAHLKRLKGGDGYLVTLLRSALSQTDDFLQSHDIRLCGFARLKAD